jgi:hypothetical protein
MALHERRPSKKLLMKTILASNTIASIRTRKEYESYPTDLKWIFELPRLRRFLVMTASSPAPIPLPPQRIDIVEISMRGSFRLLTRSLSWGHAPRLRCPDF